MSGWSGQCFLCIFSCVLTWSGDCVGSAAQPHSFWKAGLTLHKRLLTGLLHTVISYNVTSLWKSCQPLTCHWAIFCVPITNIYSRLAQINEINSIATRIRDASSRVLFFFLQKGDCSADCGCCNGLYKSWYVRGTACDAYGFEHIECNHTTRIKITVSTY